MFRTYPLLSKLLTQLAPAVVVTAVGIVMLSNLAKPVDTAPAEPAESAIAAEAVFTPLPQRSAEAQADSENAEKASAKSPGARPAAKAKPAAGNAAPVRKLASTESAVATPAVAPPLQIVPPASEPTDNSMMGKLRGVGTTVQQMPQRAYGMVTGWFAETEPPRPPAPVPMRNFL